MQAVPVEGSWRWLGLPAMRLRSVRAPGGANDVPVAAGGLLEGNGRAGEGVEAPEAPDGAGDGGAGDGRVVRTGHRSEVVGGRGRGVAGVGGSVATGG